MIQAIYYLPSHLSDLLFHQFCNQVPKQHPAGGFLGDQDLGCFPQFLLPALAFSAKATPSPTSSSTLGSPVSRGQGAVRSQASELGGLNGGMRGGSRGQRSIQSEVDPTGLDPVPLKLLKTRTGH